MEFYPQEEMRHTVHLSIGQEICGNKKMKIRKKNDYKPIALPVEPQRLY